MIPIREDKDAFENILDILSTLTDDISPGTGERAEEARKHDLAGLRALGEDAGWSLVGRAEEMSWSHSSQVYRSAVLYWAERRAAKGKEVILGSDPGVESLLLSLPSPWVTAEGRNEADSEYHQRIGYYADHVDFTSGARSSRNPHHRKVTLSPEEGHLTAVLASKIARQSHGRFTASEILAMVGIPVLAETVIENPVITQYPDEWVMSAMGVTIEGEAMRELSRTPPGLLHRSLTSLRSWAKDYCAAE